MEKLASEKAADSSASMTAVADLRTYQQFAEAHVEHLKKLTAAFETLYNSMPESQKKIADQVFSRSHRDDDSGRG
jgi:phage-related tail protein